MSSIKVEVSRISDVRVHPNADALELANVGGWQMCVPKGKFTNGDPVVYFEQGTVLPAEVAVNLGVEKYLHSKTDINGNKVLVIGRVRLRGEPSYGLVIEPEEFMQIGDDVTSYYGAEKYHPPVKFGISDQEVDHPSFPAYTDIENMRSYPDVLQDGEEVVITEKIHGTNCRVGFVAADGELTVMVGSRRFRRKDPGVEKWRESLYWFPLSLNCVQDLINHLVVAGHKSTVLYGEVYGKGVQIYGYGETGLAFRAFDIMLDGKYVNFDEFLALCELYDVPICPYIARGPYSIGAIRLHSDGDSCVGGDHGREGVVVRPVTERTDPRVGRVILKYVGDEYLLGKGGKEETTDA